MWSKCPCVSSTRRTLSRWHSSSSRSCSLAASIRSDSPVRRHLMTNTLLSYEPTTTLWTSTSAFDQCSVLDGEAMPQHRRPTSRGHDVEAESEGDTDLGRVEGHERD